ncbi:MAG: membrane protein insertion efficiency factor YidD [Candidatus Cloacimonadaceae bacterium]
MASNLPSTGSVDSQARQSLIHRILRLPNYLFIALIRFYKMVLSPIMPPTCRFYPSCSQYGLDAFRKYNIFKAMGLTVWRILRCNPFNKGGYDPLP